MAGTVKELTAGAKAYFDRVNAKGGVHGRKIVLESLDDGFDPKRTPEVFKKLIEEKQVFALFLSRGTPTNEAAYPVLEAAKVPLVGPSTGAMSMYNPPRRYHVPGARELPLGDRSRSCRSSSTMGINRIAVFLYVDDSFGKDGLTGTLQQAMKAQQAQRRWRWRAMRAAASRSKRRWPQSRKADPQAVIMMTVADAGVGLRQADEEDRARARLFLTLSNNSSNAFIKNLGEDG